MIGDPHLHNDNRSEWLDLAGECLASKKTGKDKFSPESLDGLRQISETYETVHLNSQSFQVDGQSLQKRKLLPKFTSTHKNCLCNVTISVRMWTTWDADEVMYYSKGNGKTCAFQEESGCHGSLVRITDGAGVSRETLGLPPSSRDLRDQPARLGAIETTQAPVKEVAPDDTSQIHVPDIQSYSRRLSSVINHESPTVATETNGSQHSPAARSAARHADPLDRVASRIIEKGYHEATANGLHDQQSGVEFQTEPSEPMVPKAATRPRPLPLQLALPPLCDNFVGHKRLLNSMREYLMGEASDMAPGGSLVHGQKLLVLYGVPGIGKTQLALQFAYQHKLDYDFIFWIRAKDGASVARSYHDVAIALSLIDGRLEQRHSESTSRLKHWLESTSVRWLLIYDDVDGVDYLPDFLPRSRTGSIIVTSRDPFMEKILGWTDSIVSTLGMKVPPLNSTECEAYIETRLRQKDGVFQGSTVEAISNLTEGLPLALEIATTDIEAHKELLTQDCGKKTIVSLRVSRLLSTIDTETVSVPTCISRLTGRKVLNRKTRAVWSALAFLSPEEMDISLLLAAGPRGVPLLHLPASRASLDACAAESSQTGFLRQLDRNSWSWGHVTLQEAFRETMTWQEQIDALQTISQLLLSRWPQSRRFKHVLHGFWPEFDSLHMHVRHLGTMYTSRCQADRSLKALTYDKPFHKLLTLSTW